MGVLPAAAKSFKVDRKSYFAAELKSTISDRLLRFCPNYADDVLAEYITVLVCNGKNQHQARDDLEAFLGGMSEEFVSWLWHALSKYEPSLSACMSSKADKSSSSRRDMYKKIDNKDRKFKGLQSQGNSESDNLMSVDGEKTYSLSAKVCKPQDKLHVDHHSLHVKEKMSRPIQPSGPQIKSADIDSSTKVVSSLKKYQTRNADNSQELEKSFSFLGRRPGSFPRRGTLSTTRPFNGSKLSECPRKHWTETVLGRRISPLTLVASSHDNKPRPSVWDRLGKSVEDAPAKGQTTEFYAMDKTHINKERLSHRLPVAERLSHRPSAEERLSHRPLLAHKHGEQVVQLSTLGPTPATRMERHANSMRYVRHIVENAEGDKNSYKGPNFVVETIPPVAPVSYIGRKRHFGGMSSQTDDDVAPEVVLRARKKLEVPSEASQVVLVNDVKRRLRQVEIEMTKLRSKQVEIQNDGNTMLESHGVMKAAEENNSRTILVTNVHFKATKETLSLYFGKCGAVVDVVMLTDTGKTSVTQRSAYITFESKESSDKALELSGTTFYSRTIMVSRKGESTGVSQFTGKTNQVATSHPKSGATPDKPSFPGSHLQWRRESFSEKCEDLNQCSSTLPVKPGEAETGLAGA